MQIFARKIYKRDETTTNSLYTMSWITLAFWLVLTYDLLEDRRTDDVITAGFLLLFYKKANRLHVAVSRLRNRSQ